LFKLVADHVQCVLLNACYSAKQADIIARHIDFVIGMTQAIDDKAALAFAVGFYAALGSGKSVEMAYRFGCNAIQLAGYPKHLVPVLRGKVDIRRWVLIFNKAVDEIRWDKAQAMVAHLRKLSGDTSMTLVETLTGSARLIIEGTQEGFEKVVAQIREKRLLHLTGLSIQDAQSVEHHFVPEPEIVNTLRVEVIILRQKTTKVIATWEYATDQYGHPFTLDKQNNLSSPEQSWQAVAIEIQQQACQPGEDDPHTPIDVFLYLRGPLLENLYDYGSLEKIVNDARNHAWGGNVYIAWEQKVFDTIAEKNETVLEEWFRMLSKSGVTDIIEITKKVQGDRPEHIILRACALESERRRERLRNLVS
ncbi:MAG TPA: hypothetical protein VN824_03450, partial [Puia sp.]|nr:hypothetical protein [Puia sp.]